MELPFPLEALLGLFSQPATVARASFVACRKRILPLMQTEGENLIAFAMRFKAKRTFFPPNHRTEKSI